GRHIAHGFILRDASLRDAPQDEVLDPHDGEERGKAVRLEPRGHGPSLMILLRKTPLNARPSFCPAAPPRQAQAAAATAIRAGRKVRDAARRVHRARRLAAIDRLAAELAAGRVVATA